jgi:hypothetical protein
MILLYICRLIFINVDVLVNHDSNNAVIIIARVRFGEEEYTHTIHLSDSKAVMLQFTLEIISLRVILCDLKDNILKTLCKFSDFCINFVLSLY